MASRWRQPDRGGFIIALTYGAATARAERAGGRAAATQSIKVKYAYCVRKLLFYSAWIILFRDST
ncbi:MAG: hypothetical protein RR903_04215, partial [Edwardsiella sp. (in: enterobacteria)]